MSKLNQVDTESNHYIVLDVLRWW